MDGATRLGLKEFVSFGSNLVLAFSAMVKIKGANPLNSYEDKTI